MNCVVRVLMDCCFFFEYTGSLRYPHVLTPSFPTRRAPDLAHAARVAGAAPADPLSPAERYGELFEAVQLGRVFDDSRSEEHTSELQSLMRISYAVFCLKKKKKQEEQRTREQITRKHNRHKKSTTDNMTDTRRKIKTK